MNKDPHHKYAHIKIAISTHQSSNLVGRLKKNGKEICLGDSITSDAKIKMDEQTQKAQEKKTAYEVR